MNGSRSSHQVPHEEVALGLAGLIEEIARVPQKSEMPAIDLYQLFRPRHSPVGST